MTCNDAGALFDPWQRRRRKIKAPVAGQTKLCHQPIGGRWLWNVQLSG